VEVATALTPALIIPFMVMGGFFVNQADIPYVFYPFLYLSVFKYSFQASVQVTHYLSCIERIQQLFRAMQNPIVQH
jgi:hypothetical protein